MKAWRGPFNLPTVKISYRTTPKLHLCKPNAHKVNFFNKNLWVFFFAECPVLCLLSVGVVLKVSYIQFLSHQRTTLLGMIADKLGWTPEGRRARWTPKTTCRYIFEKERNKAGWKSRSAQSGCTKRLHKTESVGQRARRPYPPTGAMRLDNDDDGW